ncbi:hypothetical protein C5167_000481 [Papaver somniferum]|uniref:Uncharacterized protein n=1 Tax=Papaver somniferum TaxID=3469 RepID=A0A4Y7KV74_PAPSO|nr:hypothetical protein C5167_000481 [Papaver somniferum]
MTVKHPNPTANDWVAVSPATFNASTYKPTVRKPKYLTPLLVTAPIVQAPLYSHLALLGMKPIRRLGHEILAGLDPDAWKIKEQILVKVPIWIPPKNEQRFSECV